MPDILWLIGCVIAVLLILVLWHQLAKVSEQPTLMQDEMDKMVKPKGFEKARERMSATLEIKGRKKKTPGQ